MSAVNQARGIAPGCPALKPALCVLYLFVLGITSAGAQTSSAGAQTSSAGAQTSSAGAQTSGESPPRPETSAAEAVQPGAEAVQSGATPAPAAGPALAPGTPGPAAPDTALTPEQRQQAAVQEFLTAIALAKNNLGAVYYAEGQYDSARVHIEHALEVAPGFAAAHLTLGLVHHAKGEMDAALAAFKQTVEGDSVSVARMSTVPTDTVYAWARSQYDKLMEGTPDLAVAHTAMAIVYNQGGYLNEAVHHYLQAIEDDSSYVDAYTNLGKVYTDTEEYAQAAEAYEKVLALSPPDDQLPRIHLNLGVSYMGLDRVDDAIRVWKRAVELSPDYMDAYMNLGTAYQSKNMPDSTRAVWERALEVGGGSIVPRVALGRLGLAEGRLSDALGYYREILDLGARDPRIYAEIALIHERREDYEQAVVHYEQALELAPDTEQLKAALNRVRRIVEERAKAIESNKIRVRQIVVVTRAEADAVMERLAAGADFAELARETSIDSSRDSGGDLGFFGPGEMIPEFEAAALGLEVGELSGVVETAMGFHIIKRIE